MTRAPTKRSYLTPREVAGMLRVSPMTIRNWSVRGWLHAELTAGGHRRYPTREVERFARERGLTLQQDGSDRHRILVVDDDEAFGNFLLASFKEHPEEIEAQIARDGFEAGHLMHTFSPTIVLLDLVMPGMDGFQVCQLIKNNPSTRSCRVIAMTGYADRSYERRVLDAGAERCLTKPMSLESTFEALGLSQIEAPVAAT